MIQISSTPIYETERMMKDKYAPGLSGLSTELHPDYEMTVNGRKCDVRQCRVSKHPFNCWWPGHQRPLRQTEVQGFSSFYADERVTITVTFKKGFSEAVIRPLDQNVSFVKDGNTVTFSVSGPGSYIVEFDGPHQVLHIFCSMPKQEPSGEQVTYYFGPGVHFPMRIELKDNESIFVDPEAVVYTTVCAENAKNVRIFGGGVIDGSCTERVYQSCTGASAVGDLKFDHCQDVRVEDVILLNSPNWVFSIFDCDRVAVENVKILGQWRYNTDGIDICNSSDVILKDSFIRSFDDTVVIKAILGGRNVCRNIEVDHCVLWCNWGHTAEIGLETFCDEYENITFRNCHLIHNADAALDIANGGYARIHHVRYENISVEFQTTTERPELQSDFEKDYSLSGEAVDPAVIRIHNHKMKDTYRFASDEKDRNFGTAFDVVYRNIRIYSDTGLKPPAIWIESFDAEHAFKNIVIDGLYLNGAKIDDLALLPTTLIHTEKIEIV